MTVPAPEIQYATLRQQSEVATLGMWAFLATEILFFGGLLLAYAVYRGTFPAGFSEASGHTKVAIGTANTVILLTSSVSMAWAVHIAEHGGGRRGIALLLGVTAVLGIVFLGLKGLEYHDEYLEGLVPGIGFAMDGPNARSVELFFLIYFMMTGLHAIHVTVGIALVAVTALRAWRGEFSDRYFTPVEVTGLYWHFVDLVWIFLYPLIYLNGRSVIG